MKENKALKILKQASAILINDHFVGTSGLHFDTYINKDVLTQNPKVLNKLAKMLAKRTSHLDFDIVVAPAMGAVILGNYVSFHSDTDISVFCEKDESAKNGFVFKRGYGDLIKGKKVLVVEDILNTGKSSKQTIDTVKEYGGKVVGLAALVNRGRVTNLELGTKKIPIITLLTIDLKVYNEKECPLCKTRVPVNIEIGHGAKFVEKQKNS